jgi:hypothetical protein
MLADEHGRVLSGLHLSDGVEVEVVAWRPRVAGDARYRVRASSNGVDGWLAGDNLRRTPEPLPAPAPAVAPPAPATEAGERRFGQRPHASRPPVPASPPAQEPAFAGHTEVRRFGQSSVTADRPASAAPPEPEPPDAGGRRFGQRS